MLVQRLIYIYVYLASAAFFVYALYKQDYERWRTIYDNAKKTMNEDI